MGASEYGNVVSNESTTNGPFIAGFDLGTTTFRCFIYDSKARICGNAECKVNLIYPDVGHVEICHNEVWSKFVQVVKDAIDDAGLTASDISTFGLSTQRATFICWNKKTGVPFHNFITWKDIRADSLVKEWNNSITMKTLRACSSVLYNVFRNKRYLASSVLKFQNIQVNIRLKWIVENNAQVKAELLNDNVLFGTIDTWIIYKLTNGSIHATDYSNASGTAIFDPFILEWSDILLKILNIPKSIFPELKDTVSDWGVCHTDIFGAPIPISTVVSDQGAALFGGFGFQKGDVKVTLGTGAFLNVNTGQKPHASVAGIYPVVGWKDKEGIVYMAEGSSNDNGSIIEWGKQVGLYKDASFTSDMVNNLESSSGVFFIPGFQGLQAPINDTQATGGFLGLTADVKKEHLVRAMLESLAYRVTQIYETMLKEADYKILKFSDDFIIRANGGVAQNDFLMQMISTLTGKTLERPKSTETSALGCCFLAGLGSGIWKNHEELLRFVQVERNFHPNTEERPKLLKQMREWERAVMRFKHWHKDRD